MVHLWDVRLNANDFVIKERTRDVIRFGRG